MNQNNKTPLSRIIIIMIFGIAALTLWAGSCPAHPHVFIESEMDIELEAGGISGIWHHWTFDEYFSAWILEEYDQDNDGLFSPEETKKLYEEAFKNLKQYGFWTRILRGGSEIPVSRIENFTVEINDNMATYSFFVPLDMTVASESDIFIAVYDESFYCQIFFPPQDIGFKGELSAWEIDYTTQKMPELKYYFGFVTPVAIKLTIVPS